ncbi:MAG: HEPN domain-containing protein [Solirubrobacteraceae bacterium]
MPDPEADAEAREWLRFADDDLVLARGGMTRRQIFRPRQVCFNAQQAAEKAIKALLVAEQITFGFTHDLEQLAQLLPPPRGSTAAVTDLAWLGQWATATRYPGGVEPDWAQAQRSVEIAATVVAATRASLDGT